METQQTDKINTNKSKVQKRRANIIATLAIIALITGILNIFSNINSNNYILYNIIDGMTIITSILTLLNCISIHQNKITNMGKQYGLISVITIISGIASAFINAYYHISVSNISLIK